MTDHGHYDIADVAEMVTKLDKRLDRIEQWQEGMAENTIHTRALLTKLTEDVVNLQKKEAVIDYRLSKSDKIVTGVSIIGIMGFIGFLASGALLMFQNNPQTGGTP